MSLSFWVLVNPSDIGLFHIGPLRSTWYPTSPENFFIWLSHLSWGHPTFHYSAPRPPSGKCPDHYHFSEFIFAIILVTCVLCVIHSVVLLCSPKDIPSNLLFVAFWFTLKIVLLVGIHGSKLYIVTVYVVVVSFGFIEI